MNFYNFGKPYPITCKKLRRWTTRIMADKIAPATMFTSIKVWADNEELRKELETIPMI